MLKTKEINGDKKNVMDKSANKMNVMRSIIVCFTTEIGFKIPHVFFVLLVVFKHFYCSFNGVLHLVPIPHIDNI